MARFYGSVQGQRGEAHRLGHSAIETVAASWRGGVKVTLSPVPGDDTGAVWVRIETVKWMGEGTGPRVLYDCPLADLALPALARLSQGKPDAP